jgi:hypothetical protein
MDLEIAHSRKVPGLLLLNGVRQSESGITTYSGIPEESADIPRLRFFLTKIRSMPLKFVMEIRTERP